MSNQIKVTQVPMKKSIGGDKGACGGQRRMDGSGGGRGNRGTSRQPAPKK